MKIDVVNAENKKVGSVDLNDEVFGGRVKADLIHESVVRANAAERRGTLGPIRHSDDERQREDAGQEECNRCPSFPGIRHR